MEVKQLAENMSILVDGKSTEIRFGELPPIREPKQVKLEGHISAPADYFQSRNELKLTETDSMYINPKTAIVTVDYGKLTILLEVNPDNKLDGDFGNYLSVTGKLTRHRDIVNSKIYFGEGTPELMTKFELIKLLKFNRRMFVDKVGNSFTELLLKLHKLDIKTEQDFGSSNDDRGNIEEKWLQKVTTELPKTIQMNIAFFNGYDAAEVTCTINIEIIGTVPKFYLECADMADQIISASEKILNTEMSRFDNLSIISKTT